MTTEELKQKLDDANGRVAKRIATMTKLCIKGGVDPKAVLDAFESFYQEQKRAGKTYMTYREAYTLVSQFEWKNDEDHNYDSEVSENLDKLFDLRLIADNWEVKYNKALNFDNEEKIPVLVQFLEQWKQLATSWYKENAKQYFNLQANEKKAMEKAFSDITEEEKAYLEKYRGRYWKHDWESRWKQNYYTDIQALTRDITHMKGHSVGDWTNREYVYDSYEVDEEKLDKVLEAEKKAKYKDLVDRITSEVGTIQDVSHLHIAATGQLNGIVTGDKRKASVETIGAGGYNIQCFHYRTLIHKIKN